MVSKPVLRADTRGQGGMVLLLFQFGILLLVLSPIALLFQQTRLATGMAVMGVALMVLFGTVAGVIDHFLEQQGESDG